MAEHEIGQGCAIVVWGGIESKRGAEEELGLGLLFFGTLSVLEQRNSTRQTAMW